MIAHDLQHIGFIPHHPANPRQLHISYRHIVYYATLLISQCYKQLVINAMHLTIINTHVSAGTLPGRANCKIEEGEEVAESAPLTYNYISPRPQFLLKGYLL